MMLPSSSGQISFYFMYKAASQQKQSGIDAKSGNSSPENPVVGGFSG